MCSVKNILLKILQNSQENACARVFVFNKDCIKKETLAQLFSREYCKIFKNTVLIEYVQVSASENGDTTI